MPNLSKKHKTVQYEIIFGIKLKEFLQTNDSWDAVKNQTMQIFRINF